MSDNNCYTQPTSLENMKLFKLLRSYLTGLDRNFKIIGHGDIPAHLTSSAADTKYSNLRGARAPRLVLLRSMAREVIFERVPPFENGKVEIAFCGASANNEREFSYVSSLLPKVFKDAAYVRSNNVSYWKTNKSLDVSVSRSLRALLFLALCIFSTRVKTLPHTLPTVARYMSRYTKHFIRYYAHYSMHGKESLPILSVVANDHTDNPVAFSMVMNFFNVPRMYVQHAEVSSIFPPLDFEFSILRNQHSLDTYKGIGVVRGLVLIAARQDHSAEFPRTLANEKSSAHVVIYLSSVFDKASVVSTIETLRSNSHVESVSIKAHPRTPASGFSFLDECQVHYRIPSVPHIAIVPNSSVAIELLHQGIKVFQLFELDNIEPDYYKFVSNRITTSINLNDLTTPFWTNSFYDKEWIDRFRSFDPSIDETWKIAIGAFEKAVLSAM